uniref:Putative integral to mitochondrial membrane n=1 Tax=Amblyomma triste TaxID=251400 RepID=A0A023G5P9_AMBTT
MTLLRTLHTLSSKNFLAGAAILRAQRCDRLHGKQAQQFFASDVQRRCMSTSSSKKQSHCDEKSSSKMLVYLGSIRSTVKMVKSLSLTSSFLGILAQPILLQKLSGSSVGATVIVVSCASFFIFVTPLMLHYITRRYVTELTYDPGTKEFNATTLTLLNRKKEMSFIADDVEVPTVPGPFTTLLAKGRPLFVEVQNFQNADALEHLLGYDKPIDLKMKPSHTPEPEQVLTKQKSTQGSCDQTS